jgi:lysophospholipase L1-like esterase
MHRNNCSLIARSLLAAGTLLSAFIPAAVAEQEHWVATWAASPQGARIAAPRPAGPPPANASAPPPAPAPGNAGGRGNGAPPGGRGGFPPPASFNNQTVRMIVRTSIGGKRARVQLSNTFGTTPVTIGAAHVALHDKGSAIVPGSDKPLMFSGKAGITIPPGAEVISDPVDMTIAPVSDLVISVFVPGEVASPTTHSTGLHTTYISKSTGDMTGAVSIDDATTSTAWYLLSGVDVTAPENAAAIIAFGDSITDGATSTPDTDSSWPSQLAKRLAANKATANVAIINEGISGNRVLADGAGVSALARFDRDVLAQPGAEWVIVMEGINDIGIAARATPPLTVDDLIAAHKQLIERAHIHGIKVIGATLTPYQGASYASPEGEAIRVAFNDWIRNSKAYDGVIDFDKATQDPQNPKQILPSFNIRDHLHPNDAGYKAMADSIDLSMFKPEKKKK